VVKGGLNRAQRIVIVVGLGFGLLTLGRWVTVLHSGVASGWVAYAPLSNTVNTSPGALHPWVQLVVWLVLALVWVIASLLLLRSPSTSKPEAGDSVD
jgi:hypothetical protein